MKLRSLEVRAFRKFAQGVKLDALQDGINLICGPNESGKSTLVRAVRAAFFERYVSTSAAQLQPWGDSGAAPEVSIAFECAGASWQLVKRFLKARRCDLSCGHESFSGEAAERKLAELLGFELPGKGASQPRHWGIPGLLWIEQGAGQDIENPVTHAGQSLKAALASAVGDLTGGEGDAVMRAAWAERGRYLTTKTGQPTGEYAAALTALNEAEAEATEAERQAAQQATLVDELAEVRARLQQLLRDQPWRELRQRAKAAEVALAAADEQVERAARAAAELDELEGRARLVAAERERWRARLAEAQARAEAVTVAQARAEQARAQVLQGEQQFAERLTAFEQARTASAAAERARLASALASNRVSCDKTLQRLAAQIKRAEAVRAGVAEAQAALVSAPEAAAVDRLRKLHAAAQQAELELRLTATAVSFEFSAGVTAHLDGAVLPVRGERRLQGRSELVISDCARLVIEPGGRNLAEAAAAAERRRADLAQALAALGAADLAAVEARLEASAGSRARLAVAEAALAEVAPAGLAALEAERLAVERERQRIARDLAEVSPAADCDPGAEHVPRADWVAEAAALADAQARLDAAAAARARAREALAGAEQALAAEREAQARSEAYLQSGAGVAEGARLDSSEVEIDRALADKRAQRQQLAQAIEASNPALLRQDLARFEASASAQEQAVQQDQQRAAALLAQLDLLGGRDLGEILAQALAARASRRAHVAELAERARAADLLVQVLEDQRRQVTERLQAPLKQHVRHYLSILWPGAEVELDAALAPAALVRGSSGGAFPELSFGMREQLGLICRLAYADLLKTAGHPTLIILDDALVHADSKRLAQMKQILFDAGQRHQILLFSCHPEKWRDLGVAPQMLAELSPITQ